MTQSTAATSGTLDNPTPQKPRRSGAERLRSGRIELLFPLAVLLILCVYLSFASEFFLTADNLSNVLGDASVLAIVAFGVTLVIISGEFDLSVGSNVGLVGTASALTMVNADSVFLGVVVGLAVGAGVGLVNGIFSAYLGVPSFIATLAMLVIARGVGLSLTDGVAVTNIPSSFTDFVSGSLFGISGEAWIAVVVLVVLYVVLHHTKLGLEIFAVGGNAEAARLAGISVKRVRTTAFVISGLAAAVAGMVLLGRLGTAQPNAGQLLELFAVAGVVLGGTSIFGGRGSVAWTVVGVLLIAVIQNGLTLESVDSNAQNIVLGSVFILAALSGVVRGRRT